MNEVGGGSRGPVDCLPDDMPDVLALPLPKAEDILRSRGFQSIRVLRTGPPRGGVPVGPERVLRQLLTDRGQVELVVSHENYLFER